MKKSLSLNGRPRNGNKARGPRFFAPGYAPSFSDVIASVIRNGPREKTIEEQSEAIIRNIKKLQKRIKKAQIFIHVPPGRETDQTAEYRRKVARWEALLYKQFFTLKYLHAHKTRMDNRELTKFKNTSKDARFVTTEQTNGQGIEHHRLSSSKAIQNAEVNPSKTSFTPQVRDSKKSTSKNTVYKDYNPQETVWDKAEKEWKEIVKRESESLDK